MKLSLCVICKDEEKKIRRCIESVKDYVDEIVIVDTGSSDNTIQIVKSLGATIFEMEWEKDFSKARNYAIDKAHGDWIIFLDADEYVLEEDRKYIRNYVIEAINRKKQGILVEMRNIEDEGIKTIFSPVRLFQNKPNIRYQGRVHEVVCDEEGLLDKLAFDEPLRILHDGYSQDLLDEKDKIERNLELLLLEYSKNPMDGNICFYLIETYKGKGDLEKACELAEKSVGYSGTLDGYNQIMNKALLELYIRLKRPYDDIIRAYRGGVSVDSTYPDYDLRLGTYYYNENMYDKAIEHFNLCLNKIDKFKGIFPSVAMGNIMEEYIMLANSYMREGRYQETVGVLIKILCIDKYQYSSLYQLIDIVGKAESAEGLGMFLEKIYDIYNVKDQHVLKQICKEVKNNELLIYFEERIRKLS